MSGYCEVGKLSIDTMPDITVRMAMTMATIGRRMKNFDIVYLPAAFAGLDGAQWRSCVRTDREHPRGASAGCR